MEEQNPLTEMEERALAVLDGCRGEANRIGMAELFYLLFGREAVHRINDTSELRVLIRGLRRRGRLIAFSTDKYRSGYYLPATAEEVAKFFRLYRRRTMTALVQEAAMRRVDLPRLLGQLELELAADERR